MRTHEKSLGDQKYIHGSWQTIVDDFFLCFFSQSSSLEGLNYIQTISKIVFIVCR